MRLVDDAIATVAAILILVVGGISCKQCQPIPDTTPPYCQGKIGRMLRAEGLEYDVYPCYDCEFARGCFTQGLQYCCTGSGLCAECTVTPVIHFQKQLPDAGTN